MQLVKYSDSDVRVYHTRPAFAGTPAFECGGLVPLPECVPALGEDGATEALIVVCPGCGAEARVPLLGGTDAQRLHAHARLADPSHPAQTLPDAIESVLADVSGRNGAPSVALALEARANTESDLQTVNEVLAADGLVVR